MKSSQTMSRFRFRKYVYFVVKAIAIIVIMILFWNSTCYFVSCYQVNNLLNKHIPVNLVKIRLKHYNRIAIIEDDELLRCFTHVLASSVPKEWGTVDRTNLSDVLERPGGTGDIDLYFTKNRYFHFGEVGWFSGDNGLTYVLPFWADKNAKEWHWMTHQFTLSPPYSEKMLRLLDFLKDIDYSEETKILHIDSSGFHYSTLPYLVKNKLDYSGNFFYYFKLTWYVQVVCTFFSFVVLIYCLKSIYIVIRRVVQWCSCPRL